MFLLDTHVLLWLEADPDRISPEVRATLADRSNRLFVSAVSAMEVATKVRTGQLNAPQLVAAWHRRLDDLHIEELALSSDHALLAGSMSWDHRNPFDRMLVAQAIVENLPLVTVDRAILSHPGIRTVTW